MEGHQLLPVAHVVETETEDDLHQAGYLRHGIWRLRAVVGVCSGLLAVVLLIGVAVFRVGGSFFEKLAIVKVGRSSLQAKEELYAWDHDGFGAIETTRGGFLQVGANSQFLGTTSSTTTPGEPWYYWFTAGMTRELTTTTTATTMMSTSETVTTSKSTVTQLAPMFCWSVLRANSYEVPLVTQQYWRKASIFACDDYAVFSHGGPSEVGPLDVMTIDEQSVGMGDVQEAGTTTSSWLNTLIFIRAWQVILEDGKWWAHEWTVKVDPDAVFFPDRLMMKLHDDYPAGEVDAPAWYVANCDRSWNEEPWSLKVFGSFEVYSRNALGMYNARQQECQDELNWKGWGEDYYMQQCMQKMGVEVINGVSFLGDSRCYPALCSDTSKVTFHDFKDEDSWFACWDEARAAGSQIATETIFLQK